MVKWRTAALLLFVSVGLLYSAQAPRGQGTPAGAPARPVVVPADRHDTSPPLRELPPIPPGQAERTPHPPLPLRGAPRAVSARPDPVLQATVGTGSVTVDNTFDGIGNIDGVLPPDTNGDVGLNDYVQWVNLSFAVYGKDGSVRHLPSDGGTLWQGFGGACETSNDGDPIALYDPLAGRWLLSQFALPNYPTGPFYQCIAVSATPDPTGAYYRYQFSFTKMNDYPKFGVWSDGYYMTMNQFRAGSLRWGGQGVVAFDRDKMLLGQPASMIYFDLYSVDPNLGGMLPADLDGATPPPSGSPDYFVQVDDDAWGYSGDQLQIWAFHADWTNPSASTFTRRSLVPVAAFDSNLCGYSRNCIPQPGTSVKVDAISDRLMYRLQYRNFGDHESLVVNHTVDWDGKDHAGVRWYEIRNPGSATPTLRQQGTFAPDTTNRWMGSAAMDKAGNIALGYNASDTTNYPSIRFTAHLAGDPVGQMTQGDNTFLGGGGSQTHSSGRWGDYSSMSVDPVDDCTFWFTTEYYTGTSSAAWKTRIGNFRLPGCGTAPAAPSNLTAQAVSSSEIDVGWTDNSSDEAAFRILRCSGPNCTPSSPVAEVGANVTAFADSGLAAQTTYRYEVVAYNAVGDSPPSNIAGATTQASGGTGGTMHLGSLTGTASSNGRTSWRATVTATVADASGNPVSNATVVGSWSAGSTGTASCTTDTAGQCSIMSKRLRTQIPSVTFTVDDVTHATLTYQAPATKPSVTVDRP